MKGRLLLAVAKPLRGGTDTWSEVPGTLLSSPLPSVPGG